MLNPKKVATIPDCATKNVFRNPLILFNLSIAINGVNQNCETFVLNRYKPDTPDYEGQDLTFNCCKTRELPYDIYVWHLLVFCAGMINNTDKFSISRDR